MLYSFSCQNEFFFNPISHSFYIFIIIFNLWPWLKVTCNLSTKALSVHCLLPFIMTTIVGPESDRKSFFAVLNIFGGVFHLARCKHGRVHCSLHPQLQLQGNRLPAAYQNIISVSLQNRQEKSSLAAASKYFHYFIFQPKS